MPFSLSITHVSASLSPTLFCRGTNITSSVYLTAMTGAKVTTDTDVSTDSKVTTGGKVTIGDKVTTGDTVTTDTEVTTVGVVWLT